MGLPPTRVGMLARPGHPSIAYRHRTADPMRPARPGVVFLHGFMSDKTGTKAQFLEDWCGREGLAYLAFDQSGHGESEGRFAEGTIGGWATDSVAVIEALTTGPQVLVGSSMGGWLALLVALRIPLRVAGLVLIAAAPDFTQDLWQSLMPSQQAAVERDGFFQQPTPYAENPLVFTRTLFADGLKQALLGGPIAIDAPVRLLHGQRDDSVRWQTSLTVADHLTSRDVEVILFKEGDHRLAEAAHLHRLAEVVKGLTAG